MARCRPRWIHHPVGSFAADSTSDPLAGLATTLCTPVPPGFTLASSQRPCLGIQKIHRLVMPGSQRHGRHAYEAVGPSVSPVLRKAAWPCTAPARRKPQVATAPSRAGAWTMSSAAGKTRLKAIFGWSVKTSLRPQTCQPFTSQGQRPRSTARATAVSGASPGRDSFWVTT